MTWTQVANRLQSVKRENEPNHRPRLVKLIATRGPLDIDDPKPAITVMMPDEDLRQESRG